MEIVKGHWTEHICFEHRGKGLADGLDVRKEGMKRMMLRFLVPFLVR